MWGKGTGGRGSVGTGLNIGKERECRCLDGKADIIWRRLLDGGGIGGGCKCKCGGG
jgi:hypothetical protein